MCKVLSRIKKARKEIGGGVATQRSFVLPRTPEVVGKGTWGVVVRVLQAEAADSAEHVAEGLAHAYVMKLMPMTPQHSDAILHELQYGLLARGSNDLLGVHAVALHEPPAVPSAYRKEVQSLRACVEAGPPRSYVGMVTRRMLCDLEQLMQRRGHYALSLREILHVARHVAGGLCFLAQRSVSHFDVKTSNVLVGYDGSVVLADFGVAMRTRPQRDFGDHKLCTVTYRAPEIVERRGRYDAKTDVWSLGVLLLSLFVGCEAFVSPKYYRQVRHLSKQSTPSAEAMKRQIADVRAQLADIVAGNERRSRLFVALRHRVQREAVAALAHDPTALRVLTGDDMRRGFTALREEITGVAVRLLALVARMLEYEPSARISAAECAAHPLLSLSAAVRDPAAHRALLPLGAHAFQLANKRFIAQYAVYRQTLSSPPRLSEAEARWHTTAVAAELPSAMPTLDTAETWRARYDDAVATLDAEDGLPAVSLL